MGSAYSPAQVERYLSYISLPSRFHPSSNPALDIDFLTALHKHQISAIPYENLVLHYASRREVVLDPQALYQKLTKNGRGGYCMENSIFFNHILRALGFQVYTAGVKIRQRVNGVPQGSFGGWVHIVNIVTLPTGERYAVDVAFGGDGPTRPLLMEEVAEYHSRVIQNLGSQQIRLIHAPLPELANQAQKYWIYQYRNSEILPWNSFWACPGTEFSEADFFMNSYYMSTHPDSHQRFNILIVRFLRREEEIYGKIMLVNNLVKRNEGGKTVVIQECKTEKERIQTLKEHFGITLTEEEQASIRGHHTETRS